MRGKSHMMRQLVLSILITTAVLLSALFSPRMANATTYFVATNGNNANPGTQTQPFRTINKGVSVLTAGDTLYIRGGTYNEAISGKTDGTPSGTASQSITISSYPGETAVAKGIFFGYGHSYLTFQNIVVDGQAVFDSYAIYFASGAHHILLVGGECTNSGASCIATAWGGANIIPHHITIRGVNVHHAGNNNSGNPPVGHGIYLAGSDNIVENCEVHHNTGGGVQLNANGTDSLPHQTGNDRNIIRNNNIHDNATSIAKQVNLGIQLVIGDDNVIYNNLIYNEPGGGIELAYRPMHNTRLYNNTIYNTGNNAIQVMDGPINTQIKNNIIWGHRGGAVVYQNNDTGTTLSNNLLNTIDPEFTNASGGDFSLQSTSPARDAGTILTTLTVDIQGTPRPQGAAYDIGAYELQGQGLQLPVPKNLKAIAVVP